jgi:hypothetical protein
MAVPTITTVSPSIGPAAGDTLVTITGTNFKVPALVYDVPVSDTITPTVAVSIGGRAVRRVDVISATEVRVLTDRFWHADPRVDAFTAVSIVLSNLQSDGETPVTGETVVKAAAYTYKRWELGAPRPDTPATRILKELLQALAIEVERNTAVMTHVDYGEEGTSLVIDPAKLPSINVSVTVEKDVEFAQYDNTFEEIEQPDGTFKIYEGARTIQLVLDVMLAGEGVSEAMHLCHAVQDFVQVHPLLRCAADPVLYPGEEDDYPIEIWGDPKQVGISGISSMVVFTMQLRVRGIRTLPDDPTMEAQTIETVTLTEQHLDSDGVNDGAVSHIDIVEP